MKNITWLVRVRLNSPNTRQKYGIGTVETKLFEVEHENDWNMWQVFGKIEKKLYHEMERGDFQILSIYCPQSNKGWKDFKLDCTFYSLENEKHNIPNQHT